jgi:hypothetical protein
MRASCGSIDARVEPYSFTADNSAISKAMAHDYSPAPHQRLTLGNWLANVWVLPDLCETYSSCSSILL